MEPNGSKSRKFKEVRPSQCTAENSEFWVINAEAFPELSYEYKDW